MYSAKFIRSRNQRHWRVFYVIERRKKCVFRPVLKVSHLSTGRNCYRQFVLNCWCRHRETAATQSYDLWGGMMSSSCVVESSERGCGLYNCTSADEYGGWFSIYALNQCGKLVLHALFDESEAAEARLVGHVPMIGGDQHYIRCELLHDIVYVASRSSSYHWHWRIQWKRNTRSFFDLAREQGVPSAEPIDENDSLYRLSDIAAEWLTAV